jgi:Flp pilus assembly protein TadD
MVSGSSLLSAQVPIAVVQQRIADEIHSIKVATDQHLSNGRVGYLWACLASDYRKAGNFEASESSYMQALDLLQREHSTSRNYATALDNFGMLYLSYGHVDDAERYSKKAAALRKDMNYPLDRAISEEHMAEIDLANHKFKEAEKEASSALEVMQSMNDPDPLDRMAALNVLAFSRCMRGRCEQGMEDARTSLHMARNGFGSESVPSAHALMAVGFALWKVGRLDDADRTMRDAIVMMKAKIGPESRLLLLALAQYRNYLNSVHREGDAENISKELIEVRGRTSFCTTCVTVNSLRDTRR